MMNEFKMLGKLFFSGMLLLSCSTKMPVQNFQPALAPVVNKETDALKTVEITRNYDAFLENCFTSKMRVSRYVKNGIQVEIFQLDNLNKLMSFTSIEGLNKYEEIYFLKNGKLIYAKESEVLTSKITKDEIVWNCQYYIENDKVFDYISLGHGKTEADTFTPNDIIELYKKRAL